MKPFIKKLINERFAEVLGMPHINKFTKRIINNQIEALEEALNLIKQKKLMRDGTFATKDNLKQDFLNKIPGQQNEVSCSSSQIKFLLNGKVGKIFINGYEYLSTEYLKKNYVSLINEKEEKIRLIMTEINELKEESEDLATVQENKPQAKDFDIELVLEKIELKYQGALEYGNDPKTILAVIDKEKEVIRKAFDLIEESKLLFCRELVTKETVLAHYFSIFNDTSNGNFRGLDTCIDYLLDTDIVQHVNVNGSLFENFDYIIYINNFNIGKMNDAIAKLKEEIKELKKFDTKSGTH